MHDMAFRVGNQYKINTRGKVEFNRGLVWGLVEKMLSQLIWLEKAQKLNYILKILRNDYHV